MNHEPRMIGEKACHGPCGRTLPVLSFAIQRKNSDGLQSCCRECISERDKHKRVIDKFSGKVKTSEIKAKLSTDFDG